MRRCHLIAYPHSYPVPSRPIYLLTGNHLQPFSFHPTAERITAFHVHLTLVATDRNDAITLTRMTLT
jgi:hypothetical protein